MLEARDLRYRFSNGTPVLDGVSISLAPGEIVGLSGPSGRGKSTLARLLCRHMTPQGGSITLSGSVPPGNGFHPVQLLAQTAIFAVNPRWRVGRIVTEAWTPDDESRDALNVKASWYDRFPHELSGGELQRVAILRSLAPNLRYLVADEITAMLDPITQAEIWRYLMRLAAERRVGILAISHDKSLLTRIADRTVEI